MPRKKRENEEIVLARRRLAEFKSERRRQRKGRIDGALTICDITYSLE
jgi:hypothetical protein